MVWTVIGLNVYNFGIGGEMKGKKRSGRWAILVLLGVMCLLECKMQTAASGTIDTGNIRSADTGSIDSGNLDISMLEEVDFSEIDDFLAENSATEDFSFKQLVQQLISGEEIDKGWLFGRIKDALFREVSESRSYMVQMVLLVAAFALLYNFANVFENAAVTDISFYIVYMILLALLIKSFLVMSGILSGALQAVLNFMQALMPAFCMSMVFSGGTASAMGFYQLTLFLIYIIQGVLTYGLVPAIHVYIILELLNHLTREELISKMTELVKIAVEWTLKALFTVVVGINVVQGLLAPVIDSFKTTMAAKTAGLIPGVSASVSAVAELMVGSGIIIKNGVGIAGILVLLSLCAGPLIKVGVMALMYKLSAAVLQPIADKRLAGCISGMGEGAGLMVRVLVSASAMFFLTVALVTASTTWNR